MNPWQSKFFGVIVALLVLAFALGFVGTYLFAIFFSFWQLLVNNGPNLKLIAGWVMVGVSLALLSTLTVWPFALALATLLQHNKNHPLANAMLKLLSYMASLPLLIFVYLYLEILGVSAFDYLQKFWIFLFASSNIFTQAIAFALTLILYPFSVLPFWKQNLSIDLFYRQVLKAVIEFAEVGLVASVVALGLFLYLLPKMVLHIRKHLNDDDSLKSFEIIKSLGGTPWESIHLTVMQSMKSHFNAIVFYFTRLAFFEGIITYSLLNIVFTSSSNRWGQSLSSQFIALSINWPQQNSLVLLCSGVLAFIYLFFSFITIAPLKSRGVENV